MLALRSTPATLEGLGFSVRVISLSWNVLINASGTRVPLLHDLAVRRRCQWTMAWTCMHQTLAGINGISQVLVVHTPSRVCTPEATYYPFGPLSIAVT